MDRIHFWNKWRGTFEALNWQQDRFEEEVRRITRIYSQGLEGWTISPDKAFVGTVDYANSANSSVTITLCARKATSFINSDGYSISIPTGTYTITAAQASTQTTTGYIKFDYDVERDASVYAMLLNTTTGVSSHPSTGDNISASNGVTAICAYNPKGDDYQLVYPYLVDLISPCASLTTGYATLSAFVYTTTAQPTITSTTASYCLGLTQSGDDVSTANRKIFPFSSATHLMFVVPALSSVTLSAGETTAYITMASATRVLVQHASATPSAAIHNPSARLDTAFNNAVLAHTKMPYVYRYTRSTPAMASAGGLGLSLPSGTILFSDISSFDHALLQDMGYQLCGTYFPGIDAAVTSADLSYDVSYPICGLVANHYIDNQRVVSIVKTSNAIYPTVLTERVLSSTYYYHATGADASNRIIAGVGLGNHFVVLYQNGQLKGWNFSTCGSPVEVWSRTITGHSGASGAPALVVDPTSSTLYIIGGDFDVNGGVYIHSAALYNKTLTAAPSASGTVGQLYGCPENIAAATIKYGINSGANSFYFMPYLSNKNIAVATTGRQASVVTNIEDFSGNGTTIFTTATTVNISSFPGDVILDVSAGSATLTVPYSAYKNQGDYFYVSAASADLPNLQFSANTFGGFVPTFSTRYYQYRNHGLVDATGTLSSFFNFISANDASGLYEEMGGGKGHSYYPIYYPFASAISANMQKGMCVNRLQISANCLLNWHNNYPKHYGIALLYNNGDHYWSSALPENSATWEFLTCSVNFDKNLTGGLWSSDKKFTDFNKLAGVYFINLHDNKVFLNSISAQINYSPFALSGKLVMDISAVAGATKFFQFNHVTTGGTSITYNISGGTTRGASTYTCANAPINADLGDNTWYRVEAILNGVAAGTATPILQNIQIKFNDITSRLGRKLLHFYKFENGSIRSLPVPDLQFIGPSAITGNMYGDFTLMPYKHLILLTNANSNYMSANTIAHVHAFDTITETWNYTTQLDTPGSMTQNESSANSLRVSLGDVFNNDDGALYYFGKNKYYKYTIYDPLLIWVKKQ